MMRRLLRVIPLLALALSSIVGVAAQPGRPISDADARQMLYALTHTGGRPAQEAMERIRARNDQRFVAVFIELLRASTYNAEREAHVATLEALSGQQFGRDWVAWREWYATTDLGPPPGFATWKGILLGRIDPGFRAFLSDVHSSTIRIEEIVWGGVIVDGIPPLDNPPMLPAADATYLDEGEPVFGLVVNGEARAYPLRIMDHHEMANDVVGGEPVTLAYCTMCGAGIAYRTTQPDGVVFDFGTSGLLYHSNKLMYDRQTRTLWNQLTGVPVVGELAGSGIRLDVLPIVLTTWVDWLASHPDTLVLDLDTGFERQYLPGTPYSEYFTTSGTWFPAPRIDDRLPDKAQIFAIEINGVARAYPLDVVLAERVINDDVGGVTLVVVGSGEQIEVSGVDREGAAFRYGAGAAARAYERDGRAFSFGSDPGRLRDERGNLWTVTEDALIGPAGERLARLPGHLAFWFGWSAFYPDAEVYAGALETGD